MAMDPLMPSRPSLAVIISCYNYASFIRCAIDSVVSQMRDDCELVVVDDGSTDGSWDIICSTGVPAYRIDNAGQRSACLYGLDRTTAPFVMFLDADDALKPGSLATIVDLLDANVAKLQFSLTLIDSTGSATSGAYSSLETFRNREELISDVLRSGVYKTPPTSGNVFRRDLCEFLRDVDYDKAVDGVILFAAPFLGDIVSVSDELGCYRIHGRNDSGLGRMPDAASLQRDMDRFSSRMEHLRKIVTGITPGRSLVATDQAFYFRERKVCLDIASGHISKLTALPGLLTMLSREPFSVKNKLAIAAFFALASVLPNRFARILLAYRLQTGRRTFVGLAKQFAGSGAGRLG
jgi:glycosyltransferase involved in cell wall biosynthesis